MSARTVDGAAILCHCRQVHYRDVEAAIEDGARSLNDLQRQTTACTRCFGCRFELEALLRERLGPAYVESEVLTRIERRHAEARRGRRRAPLAAPVLPHRQPRGSDVDPREGRHCGPERLQRPSVPLAVPDRLLVASAGGLLLLPEHAGAPDGRPGADLA